jgi:small subunit ribosomal protein S13
MVYILNTNLNNNKKVLNALCNIFGIGLRTSKELCGQMGISSDVKIYKLSNFQIDQLSQMILQLYTIGPELQRTVGKNIQRLIKIASYRGFRHTESLPTRGQRTHTNARTARKLKKKF